MRRSMAALAGLYFVNTAMTSGLAPRYAEIVTSLGISPAQLGLVLSGEALGLMLVIFAAAPRISDRYGARAVARSAALAFCLVIPLVGVAGSWAALFAVFLASGAVNAVLELGMTRLTTGAEQQTGRTLLPYLEIPAGLGALLGAAAGAAAAGRIDLSLYTAGLGAIGGLIVLLAWRCLPAIRRQPAPPAQTLGHVDARQHASGRSATLLGLCLLAAAGQGTELAILDWGSLLFHELGAPTTQYGLGNLAFVSGATIALLTCSPLADRYGRSRILTIGAIVAIAGMTVATIATSPALVAAALGITGLGMTPAFPLALSAAGAFTAREQARVIGAAYIATALMRPAVAALSTVIGIQAGLGALTITLCVLILLLARTAGGAGNAWSGPPAPR